MISLPKIKNRSGFSVVEMVNANLPPFKKEKGQKKMWKIVVDHCFEY